MTNDECLKVLLFVTATAGMVGSIGISVFLMSLPQDRKSISREAEEILKIHRALLAAHMKNDVQGILAAEADEIVVVSRGEIMHAAKKDRIEEFARYLAHSKFERYEDIVSPIVRVSEDGTSGWLIAQVKIIGHRTDDKGRQIPIDSTWAWIELYEKQHGRWLGVGEA